MLKTRHIFLDTSIFIALNYQYTGSVFRRLLELSKNGTVFLHLTPITISEINAHISADVHKANQAINKFRKDARVFRNLEQSPFKEFFLPFVDNEIEKQLIKQLEDFITEASVNIIELNGVSTDEVFKNYFGKKPPFGETKKKDEFPDAFVLAALEGWCEKNNERIYVASTDPDLKSFCETSQNLFYIKKAIKFIDLITLLDQTLAPLVHNLLRENEAWIKELIEDRFKDIGFWLEDQEGDVNDIDVDDIEILEESLLKVDPERAQVALSARIKFNADVIYDDLATASYDSEDKVLIPWQKIEETVEQEVNLDVSLEVAIDVDDPEFFEIEDIDIQSPGMYGIGITVEDIYY